MRSWSILCGDAGETLRGLRDESVHCIVTSPPYWGLRDYGHAGQIGLEESPEEYVKRLVGVFREARRVLRSDGVLWLNLGDSYAATIKGSDGTERGTIGRGVGQSSNLGSLYSPRRFELSALKPKDLIGIPWRVALALQADGWWLRSDVIWSKPNPMPESVRDRPTKAHEYVFLLTKSARYFWNQDAAREPYQYGRDHHRNVDNPPESYVPGSPKHTGLRRSGNKRRKTESWGAGDRPGNRPGVGRGFPWVEGDGRNIRTVWTITTKPFPGAHFATFPPELAERCIKVACPEDGLVLDPFCGAGTAGLVALRLNRRFLGIELNPTYCQMARRRILDDAPLLNRKVSA